MRGRTYVTELMVQSAGALVLQLPPLVFQRIGCLRDSLSNSARTHDIDSFQGGPSAAHEQGDLVVAEDGCAALACGAHAGSPGGLLSFFLRRKNERCRPVKAKQRDACMMS